MGDSSSFAVGQTVEVQDGITATVRFVGTTHFAPGDWIGVELAEPIGKNDGAVRGQRYFDCPPAHGMFIRPAAAEVIEGALTPKPPPKPQVPATNGTAKKPRPSSSVVGPGGLRRQSVVDPVAKRRSVLQESPTPGARAPAPGRSLRVRWTVFRKGHY